VHIMQTASWIAVRCVLAALLTFPALAKAQTADEVNQARTVFGDRVEAAAILGGSNSASGGLYKYNTTDATINASKVSGRGDLFAPRPLGSSGLSWNPIAGGSFGTLDVSNNLKSGSLAGNRMEYDSFFVSFGGGGRLWFTERLSTAVTVDLLYNHVRNTFTALTPTGVTAKQLYGGTLLDWTADVLSVVPGMDVRYRTSLTQDLVLDLTSGYTHYATWALGATSQSITLEGNADTWTNKIDLDQRLPWKLFDHPLHVGGYFSRMELYGGAARGFNADYLYSTKGRLVVGDLPGIWKAWFMNWLGVGVTYFWSDSFSGWSYGIDARFKF